MSLDADITKLTKHGTVTIYPSVLLPGTCQIFATGFEGDNCSCRDVAALALIWAIGELQRELLAVVQEPGNNNVGVG